MLCVDATSIHFLILIPLVGSEAMSIIIQNKVNLITSGAEELNDDIFWGLWIDHVVLTCMWCEAVQNLGKRRGKEDVREGKRGGREVRGKRREGRRDDSRGEKKGGKEGGKRRKGKEGRRERQGKEGSKVSLCFLFLDHLKSILSSKHLWFLGTRAQSRVIKLPNLVIYSGGNSQMHSSKLPDNWIIKGN